MDSRLRGNDGIKGTQRSKWIPAFAGMTSQKKRPAKNKGWIPAFAGMTSKRGGQRPAWRQPQRQRFRMQRRRPGQDIDSVERELASAEVSEDAAGLAHDDGERGDVE